MDAADVGAVPLCPITGTPARRLIQPVSASLLIGLWRFCFRVDASGLLAGVRRFGLWESACGLAFFEPMRAGDAAFYGRLYRRLKLHRVLAGPLVDRPEFVRAAELVRAGDRVLDVGGGEGGFSRHVPHARYVGLEPNDTTVGPAEMRRESLAEHARVHPAGYDVVCAFQVIEHVAEPLRFATDLVACLRPGGRLIIGVPRRGSGITEIPNFAFNAPPHHLTWWTEEALGALAIRCGLEVEFAEPVRLGSHDSILYWMGRMAPPLKGGRFFRAHWAWYLAFVWCWLAGRVADACLKVPKTAEPVVLVMAARKGGESEAGGRVARAALDAA